MEKKESWCTPCPNPRCAAVLRIKITPHQYGKPLKIICPKCKTECQTIPKQEQNEVEGILKDAKDFLSGLPKHLHEFLFGSNSDEQ